MKFKNNSDKRGEETKLSIINAALDLFGELGYDATSTRMITQRAKANISAIGYYFGGKEGLYMAVIESIMSDSDKYLKTLFESADKFSLKSKISKIQSFKILDIITESLAEMFVKSEESKSWAKLIIREQANPSEAFDMLYEDKIKPLQELYCKVVASILEIAENSTEVKIMSHALFGQILSFAVSREGFLRMMGVKELSDKDVKLVKEILIQNSRSCLVK